MAKKKENGKDAQKERTFAEAQYANEMYTSANEGYEQSVDELKLNNKRGIIEGRKYHDNISVRTDNVEVDVNEPYRNDKLHRRSDGDKLVGIVDAFKTGAVIALDGAWGTGKTTFVQMWKIQLENNKFPVIYYNAWENDIDDEPLFSMMEQLKSLNKKDGLDKVFQTGAKVIVGGMVGALTELNPLAKGLKGFVKGASEKIEKEVLESLKENNSRSKLMADFREALTTYVELVCGLRKIEKEASQEFELEAPDNFKPLVYIIDDLDRCNPTFAVRVLERMKHLFAVPNVVFVMAIDKQQMAYSINGYYGSDQIDSEDYLQKFIDIDYKLPKMDTFAYCKSLYKFHEFNNVAADKPTNASILLYVYFISEFSNLSLRQIQRMFSLMRIVYPEVKGVKDFGESVFVFMIYLKICEPELYDKVKAHEMTIQDFCSALESLALKPSIDSLIEHNKLAPFYYFMISSVLWGYYNYLQSKTKIEEPDDLFDSEGNVQLELNRFSESETKQWLLKYKELKKSFGELNIILDEIDMLARTRRRGYKTI